MDVEVVKRQLQQLLGLANDDIDQCMTSMTSRHELAILADRDWMGHHKSVTTITGIVLQACNLKFAPMMP